MGSSLGSHNQEWTKQKHDFFSIFCFGMHLNKTEDDAHLHKKHKCFCKELQNKLICVCRMVFPR